MIYLLYSINGAQFDHAVNHTLLLYLMFCKNASEQLQYNSNTRYLLGFCLFTHFQFLD